MSNSWNNMTILCNNKNFCSWLWK